jgi:light-regulated signal transduction histidine kinase (bacteriophytochrome)
MHLHLFPHGRRAYIRSAIAGLGAFLFAILVIHGLLTDLGLRAEATYLDDTLVGIAAAVLVLALEARFEADLRAERERALLSLGLNHHVRNALQTIVYVSSTMEDKHNAGLLSDAARRIEWAIREVPKQAQAHEPTAQMPNLDLKESVENSRTGTNQVP